jgi:V8-like Glu-specific endopeptidase
MKHSIVAISSVMFLVFALALMPFGQSQATATPKLTSISITPAKQQAALKHWTRDAMVNTKAAALLVDQGKAVVGTSSANAALAALGSTGSMPGAADPNAVAAAKQAFASDWQTSDQTAAEITADQMAGTFTTYDSMDLNYWAPAQTIYPHVYVGRLYFQDASSGYYCSATALGGNTFVTAAHCVYNPGVGWYKNWVFTPAYRSGSAPYGSFAATACTILTAWMGLTGGYSIVGWTPYDVAVCTVGNNSAGYSLNAMVGHAGWTYNAGFVKHFFNLGYPWYDTNGNALSGPGYYLRTCVGESYSQSFPVDVLGMGCNLGPGMSGGPWLYSYRLARVSGYVDSVNSGYYLGSPSLYGIRFTSSNIVPICSARGC